MAANFNFAMELGRREKRLADLHSRLNLRVLSPESFEDLQSMLRTYADLMSKLAASQEQSEIIDCHSRLCSLDRKLSNFVDDSRLLPAHDKR